MKKIYETSVCSTGRRAKEFRIEVEVNFVPFPSEERRKEAYTKWVKAFLSAKVKKAEGRESE